jgi:hypothetical protein
VAAAGAKAMQQHQRGMVGLAQNPPVTAVAAPMPVAMLTPLAALLLQPSLGGRPGRLGGVR